ncbi:hypothetical protein, partial [Caldifermentibacillus hisashii]|uniref:hypothetical protein n=1 Tax=Caldifermentibacillus hisashii TaxID=996558 RepID=UPI000BC368B9
GSKRRREKVSSSKKWVFSPKMVTRTFRVVKMEQFSAQSGDEKRSRRQKSKVFVQKTTTRKGLVVKNEQFPAQSGDEKGSRRQKSEFSASKW